MEGYLKELETGATALEELRSAGTIKAFGAGCNFFTPNEQKCEEFARRIADIADLDFFLIAGGHYTLLDQQKKPSISIDLLSYIILLYYY